MSWGGIPPGASASFGGAAATVGAVTATSLTVVAPAHAFGPVDVTVVNPDGQAASLLAGFTYAAPAPTLASAAPAPGPIAGGTSVVLTGSGFLPGASASFGGAAAAVTALTATSITVSAPTHAVGTASIVVTNPDGQAATLAAGFTYTAPAPTLASVAPATGSTAGGSQASLAGTGFLPGATVSFGGVAGVVVSLSATAVTVTVPAHAAGPADVTLANPDGQAATLAAAFTFAAPAPTVDAATLFTTGLTQFNTAHGEVLAAITARKAGNLTGAAALDAQAAIDFAAARATFDQLKALFPAFAQLDQATFLAGRSSYEIGNISKLLSDYVDAQARLDAFELAFPASTFMDQAAYFDGRARFHQVDYAGALPQFQKSLAVNAAGTFADNAQFYVGRTWFELGFALKNVVPPPLLNSAAWLQAKADFQAAEAELAKVEVLYPLSVYIDEARYYEGAAYYEEPVDITLSNLVRIANLEKAELLLTQVINTPLSVFITAAHYWRGKAEYTHSFETATKGLKNQVDLAAALADMNAVQPPDVYADNALYFVAKIYVYLVVTPGTIGVCLGGTGLPPTSACGAVTALDTLKATNPLYALSTYPALARAYVGLNLKGCTCP
ncbi:MAG TPA: IPT/TIG domain-containing protein [Anaeromyxobacteraceae bacterium]|nr:IPT/TIG domain-containing protein [Anaeromyxobacteraceae bacterium]